MTMQFFKFLLQNPLSILWLWLGIINLAAFIAMGADKRKAVHGAWRTPEKTLFLLAAIGGSVGGIAGMYAFRHKTKHRKFFLGFPLILIFQLAVGIFIYLNIK